MSGPASIRIEDGVIDALKNVSRRPIEPALEHDLVADLGFDSLQVLELIAELEDRSTSRFLSTPCRRRAPWHR
jgi:acyl carrier protein